MLTGLEDEFHKYHSELVVIFTHRFAGLFLFIYLFIYLFHHISVQDYRLKRKKKQKQRNKVIAKKVYTNLLDLMNDITVWLLYAHYRHEHNYT